MDECNHPPFRVRSDYILGIISYTKYKYLSSPLHYTPRGTWGGTRQIKLVCRGACKAYFTNHRLVDEQHTLFIGTWLRIAHCGFIILDFTIPRVITWAASYVTILVWLRSL